MLIEIEKLYNYYINNIDKVAVDGKMFILGDVQIGDPIKAYAIRTTRRYCIYYQGVEVCDDNMIVEELYNKIKVAYKRNKEEKKTKAIEDLNTFLAERF